MITQEDITVIRQNIWHTLSNACAHIRHGDYALAQECITFAHGQSVALWLCDGGPGVWGSLNRVSRLLENDKAHKYTCGGSYELGSGDLLNNCGKCRHSK